MSEVDDVADEFPTPPGEVEVTAIAGVSSFPDLSSSAVTPALADTKGVLTWSLGVGSPTRTATPSPSLSQRVVVVKSDMCPDVVCDLVAEYLTDTILRVDNLALVNLYVTLKQDLLLVTGEVGCSHPAKSAIVHSDQFIATLNGSLREVLRDIGYGTRSAGTSPPSSLSPPTVASPQETEEQTPKKNLTVQSSAATVVAAEANNDDEYIDPSQMHVIIALTAREPTARTEWSGSAAATAGADEELYSIGRGIERKIAETHPRLPGGVVVEIESDENSVTRISVSMNFGAADSSSMGDLGRSALTTEFLKSLSPAILDSTVVVLRNVNRCKATGISSAWSGKDWKHPARVLHALTNRRARDLVRQGHCERCKVLISARVRDETEGFTFEAVHVNAMGTKNGTDMTKVVVDALADQRANREYGDRFQNFFALHTSGGTCSEETQSTLS